MGDDLWQTRMRWYGYSGCAKLHGRRVPLVAPPLIPGITVVCIDYVPEIGMRMVQPLGEPLRDMRDDEVLVVDALLRELCGP